jgi:signal peptidase II
MFKINLKKIFLNLIIVLAIFFIDRASKIYILNILELKNSVDIYINTYLNFYLIWNKGIAFGILSLEETFAYNLITAAITIITIIVLILCFKNRGLKRYCFMSILGGSMGNLFDRWYYSAVPDFIDFHINQFHWFIFNVADIFITLGIVCLIYAEIFLDKGKNEKII